MTVQLTQPAEQRTDAYQAALRLVAWLEKDLKSGRRGYFTQAGQRLDTIDEVVQALLDGNLLVQQK